MMDGGLILIGTALIAYILIAPAVALFRQRGLTRQIRDLTAQIGRLEARLGRLSQPAAPRPEPARDVLPETAGVDARVSDDTQPEEPGPEPEQDATPETTLPEGVEAVPDGADASPDVASPPRISRPPPRPADPARPPRRSLEETLTSQWMIWLGGLTIALSAVFLFKFAVDEGWLTPMTRVVLGLLLGGALLAAGEWTLRHPVAFAQRDDRPDYVPPALTASGIFAIFASLFAAHALFGLLTAPTAFVALGLVAYAALVLSLRQGWFVALLGLAAGYLVPALIDSPVPQAVPLFVYLFVLTAGCLTLMVWRHWWWFSALTLSGALFWPVVWLLDFGSLRDQMTLGLYAVGLAALFAILSTKLPVKQPETPMWSWLSAMISDTSGLGFTLSGVLVLALAIDANFNEASFVFLALYAGLALGLATQRAALESLVVAAAAIVLVGFVLWPEPAQVSLPDRAQELGVAHTGTAFGPFVLPQEFVVYSRALWGFAALFGLGGFFGLARARTVALWAGVSAAMPVLLFVLGYWRIGNFEVDVNWAFVAAGLSGAMLFAASQVGRLTGPDRRDVPLALYAAGCTAALALAFTCVMREAWLTVALGIEVLALAWIWSKLGVRELRAIAAILVGVVAVRLVANPVVLDYEGTVLGIFSWVVYGYGIPAMALLGASRIFGRDRSDGLGTLCEIAAVGFAILLVSLQLKIWTSGALVSPQVDLLDQAAQVLWWIIAAGLLLQRSFVKDRRWMRTAGLGLLAAAAVLILGGPLGNTNPLFSDQSVGGLPVLNLLGLAYLAPAILLYALSARPEFNLPANARQGTAILSGILVFVYVTLETRRSFWGSDIQLTPNTPPSDGEIYAYSAVWILFALGLLAAGILRGSVALRYASLAVLILTVVKVFLYDMSDLTGLYRVASFLGLGLTLIGIGHIYRRFVFAPRPPE